MNTCGHLAIQLDNHLAENLIDMLLRISPASIMENNHDDNNYVDNIINEPVPILGQQVMPDFNRMMEAMMPALANAVPAIQQMADGGENRIETQTIKICEKLDIIADLIQQSMDLQRRTNELLSKK
jgi:hypothetical protein